MRPSFLAPPAPDRLTSLPLHVLVRDYPETLAVLRARGVSLTEHGGVPLSRTGGDVATLQEEILRVTAWRAGGRDL